MLMLFAPTLLEGDIGVYVVLGMLERDNHAQASKCMTEFMTYVTLVGIRLLV